MSTGLKDYKAFIDGIVAQASRSLQAERVGGKPITGYAEVASAERDGLLNSLSQEQREVMARMVQSAHQAGVHETLWFINERVNNGLRLVQDGMEFPVEPFERMNYDWLCRMQGDAWPDER